METSRTPTLEDPARLLDNAAGGDHHPESRDTAPWLIQESAAELYAELAAGSGEAPSPMELARFECAATAESGIPEALEAAHWLVAQSEMPRSHLTRLEQLAADVARPATGTTG